MAKDGKLKVPKRIAGVKVPKKVRKTARKALAAADHPVALELAVAALTAAAAALRERGDGRKLAAVKEGAEAVKDQAVRLSDVVIAAAMDGARRLLAGIEIPAAWQAEGAKPGRKRKAPSARPEPAPAPPGA